MKEDSHKGPHNIGFHLYGVSRTGKPTEMESRFAVAQLGQGSGEDADGLPFGVGKSLGTRQR